MADGTITIDLVVGTQHATVPLKDFQASVDKISGRSIDGVENSLNKAGKSASEASSKQKSFNDNVEHVNDSKIKSTADNMGNVANKAQEASNKTKDFRDSTEHISSSPFSRLKDAISGFGERLTGASNKTKTLGTDIKHADEGGNFSKTRGGLNSVSSEAEHTKGHFSLLKDVIAGTFLGSALTAGVSMAVSGLKSVATNGFEAAKSANEMAEKWHNLGMSAQDIAMLGKQVDNLRENSNLSAGSITNLQTRFFDLTHSAAQARELTNGVASLSDRLKMTSSQSDAFANSLTRIEASGKVSSLTMSRLEKTAPGIGTAMQQASGMSAKAFDQLISSGKMTSTQFNKILSNASKSYQANANDFDRTEAGAANKLKQTWEITQKNLMKPLVNVAATGLVALNKLVSSKVFQSGISALGNGMAYVVKVLSGGVNYVTKFIDSFSKISSSNKSVSSLSKTMSSLGKVIQEVAKYEVTLWKTTLTDLESLGKGFSKYLIPIEKDIQSIVNKLGKTLVPIINTVISVIKKNMPALNSSFGTLGKTIGQVTHLVLILIQDFIRGVDTIAKYFQPAIKRFVSTISTTFGNIIKTVRSAFKVIGDLAQVFIDLITGHWSKLGKDLGKLWRDAWNLIKNVGVTAWDFIKGAMQTVFSAIATIFKSIWNGIASFFRGIWNGIKSIGSSAWNWISSTMGNVFRGIGNTFRSIWNGISGFFGRIWNTLKNTGSSAWNWISRALGGTLNSISSGWRRTWNGVASFFGGVWNNIKGIARSGINGVIGIINTGIGGIDSVIHAFGGSRHAIGFIPRYAKGTKGAPEGLALVNDGAGQELIIDNKKQAHLLSGKNRLVNFEGGETVVPYEATKQLGSIVHHFAGGTGDWLSGVFGWIKDKWNKLTQFISHPLSAVGGIMTRAINGLIGGKSDLIQGLAPSLGHGFVNGIISPITSLFKSLKKKHDDEDGGGHHGNPGGAGVQRWRHLAELALKANGLSTGLVDKVLRQIATESGGNPTVVQGNIGDVNNATGNLARGLMQVIPPTFNAFKFPGHNDPFNGYDSLLAGINYAKHTYGPNLNGLGEGHGYADGGWVTGQNVFMANDGGYQEMVLSTDPNKRGRTIALLNDFLKKTHLTAENTIDRNVHATGQSVGNSSVVNNNVNVNMHFDQLIWNNKEDIRKTARDLGWLNVQNQRGRLA